MLFRLAKRRRPHPLLHDDDLRARVREIVARVLAEQSNAPTGGNAAIADPRAVAIGADHGGFQLKQQLLPFLIQEGYHVLDCGTFSPDPVDYPDIAYAVARLVSNGAVARGIIIDGAGIGSAMVANKVPGVRAAMCYDSATARNAREHNDANVLTLGARMMSADTARELVMIFLTTECTEPRHQKRVAKIMKVEQRYLKR